ncbi:hypothetical protein D8674_034322 [Pyrus ussuriensis x Pyrus communis]|uniref:Uncharacterized protein n=1 Tax=Pyrus ussuriensis x Pyrus communis TaxID=2448454 RepID=A0A5N5HRT3_9ROSA|nr:hypothetical protein D8674_034322 [Pyrus ussuriensis x Pyrus communis]
MGRLAHEKNIFQRNVLKNVEELTKKVKAFKREVKGKEEDEQKVKDEEKEEEEDDEKEKEESVGSQKGGEEGKVGEAKGLRGNKVMRGRRKDSARPHRSPKSDHDDVVIYTLEVND